MSKSRGSEYRMSKLFKIYSESEKVRMRLIHIGFPYIDIFYIYVVFIHLMVMMLYKF